jgi:subtilisin-like proprotein convertase family protein
MASERTPNPPPSGSPADPRRPRTPASTASHPGGAFALPHRFEPNRGQAEASVRFLSRGQGYTLSLTDTGATLAIRREREARRGRPGTAPAAMDAATVTLAMTIVGATARPHITGEALQADRAHYVQGGDRERWLAGIPSYARVRYAGVYPGIDLVYYYRGGDLEYDFIVAPGGDPGRIRLGFSGASPTLTGAGDLVLRTAAGELRQPAPTIYQEVGGERRTIPGGFVLATDGQVRFEVGTFDRRRPLVIDPVLSYATYLGGGADETGADIAVDANRNAYVVGTRPSARGTQDTDAFVAKYNAAGALLWITNVGDTCDDEGRGIAVDTAGNAYITGHIGGICYPYPTLTAGAFVAKLSPNGAGRYMFAFSHEWSGADVGQAVAVDGAGNAYVGGVTSSQYFPTTPGVLQPQYSGWYGDGFVVKVNAAGTARVYATYLGGTGHESLNDLVVDTSGNAYAAGSTDSRDFPITAAAYQRTHNGWGAATTNGFVAKLNANGRALVYSTYLGGSYNDVATSLALDGGRNAYIAGSTESADFPTTAGAWQRQMSAQPWCDAYWEICTDAFVTKLNAAGSALVYSTFLGAGLSDDASGIAVDAAGNAHVTGSTWSTDFPTLRPVQPNRGGDLDAFVTKLNATGSALVYSSYLGGAKWSDTFSEGEDAGARIALDPTGANAFVTGLTRSPNFPVTAGAQQPVFGGGLCSAWSYRCADAFVVRIADDAVPTARAYAYAGPAVAIPDNQPAGVQIPIAVTDFAGTIADLDVRFDGHTCTAAAGATGVGLTHTWVGDLVITLTSPWGTTVTLMNQPGGGGNAGDNFCQTRLDDEGGAASIQTIAAAGAPFGGTFRAAGALSAFRGQNPNGTWVLTIKDVASQDVGTVRAFSVILTGAP